MAFAAHAHTNRGPSLVGSELQRCGVPSLKLGPSASHSNLTAAGIVNDCLNSPRPVTERIKEPSKFHRN